MTAGTLRRSRDAYVGGVCAGIAEYFDIDPIVVRIIAVLVSGVTFGFAVIVYLAMWAKIPLSSAKAEVCDVRPEWAESSMYGSVSLDNGNNGKIETIPFSGRVALACGLVLLFIAVAAFVPPVVRGTQWWQFWPVVFVICGLCLVILPSNPYYASALHAAGIAIAAFSVVLLPMSLGVVSWNTLPHAFSLVWFLVILGVALYIIGFVRGVAAIMMAGAFCIVMFCMLTLFLFGQPGDIEQLELLMPWGRWLVLPGPGQFFVVVP